MTPNVYLICTIGSETYEIGLDSSDEIISLTRASYPTSQPEELFYDRLAPVIRARLDARVRHYITQKQRKDKLSQ